LNNKTKQSVFAAFLMLMRPAARLLLRCGVSWKEAAELTKMAFVEAAADEFGKHGRPANSSRIALVTGLGRREVKRVRDLLESPAPLDTDAALNTVNQASRLLSGWHQDPGFSTEPGKPKLLAYDGHGGFEALAKRYAPDIPATVILKELKAVGAIRETAGGRLRVLARYYMPSESAVESMVRSGSVLADFSTTVVHNLFAGGKPTRFEARATSLHVRRRAERAFQQYLEREAMAFLENADGWLSAHEVAADDDEPGARLGVGVYMIRDEK
jgi:hypothetical protein